jgi:hypothetical protein
VNGTLEQRIEQADRAISTIDGLTWDSVYDGLLARIAADECMTAKDILPHADKVFDATRRNLGPSRAAVDVSRAIALEFISFREQVLQSFAAGYTDAPAPTETEPTTTIDPYSDIPV